MTCELTTSFFISRNYPHKGFKKGLARDIAVSAKIAQIATKYGFEDACGGLHGDYRESQFISDTSVTNEALQALQNELQAVDPGIAFELIARGS
jgi:hypothetical protein